MTNIEMQNEVAKNLGNMKSSSIWYVEIQNWVNRALNRVVQLAIGGNKQNMNLFYELQTSWTTDTTTTVDQNWITIPDDKLVITEVQQYQSATAVNKNSDRTYPMRFMNYNDFMFLTRGTTTTGWPRMWSRRGKRIYVWPTPHTDYLTYLELIGVMKEPALSADSDTPNIDTQWHDIVTQYATYLGAAAMGWDEVAARFEKLALGQIKLTADFVAMEEAATDSPVTIEGMPTRSTVEGYGYY